jgi:hypothetical protein
MGQDAVRGIVRLLWLYRIIKSMGAGGQIQRGSASQITPNVYNRFQNAVMERQEAGGARVEGMAGRDQYMNSAPLYQEMAAAGEAREGMLGPALRDPQIRGRMENAVVQNTAANSAGMLGDAEVMGNGMMPERGMDMGPGRSNRDVRRPARRKARRGE